MKTRIIFTSLFAIMMFGVMANGQNGRLFVGTDVGVFVTPARTPSSELPTLNLIAGQPIRINVAVRKDEKKDDIIVGAGAQPHVKTTQIPCESVPSTSVRKGNSEYMTITFPDLIVSSTEVSWKNTCRLLTIKMQDGKEYRARLRFR